MSQVVKLSPVPVGNGLRKPVTGSPPVQLQTRPESLGRKLSVTRGIDFTIQRVVIYGPGGVGKTELVSLLAKIGIKCIFIDLENGSNFLDVARISPAPESFEELLQSVQLITEISDCHALVVDSLTKAEELAVNFTLRNVQHEKKYIVSSIEGYGFGKGYTHVYESFLLLLQALDAAARAGKHIICICHDCTANVPNPAGEDWIRYEPRLQSPTSGKGSIRHRVKEWCDHLLYLGYDAKVSEEGKAKGTGTRTIFPVERPIHWAKSRRLSKHIIYKQGDPLLWQQLFNNESEE